MNEDIIDVFVNEKIDMHKHIFENSKELELFVDNVNKLINCLDTFKNIANGLLKILDSVTDLKTSKYGLSSYIVSLLRTNKQLSINQIILLVEKNQYLKNVVTDRSIKDSLRYLKNRNTILEKQKHTYCINPIFKNQKLG